MRRPYLLTSLFVAIFVMILASANAHQQRDLILRSPDGRITVKISCEQTLNYSVLFDERVVIDSSPLQLELTNGEMWGVNPRLKRALSGDIKRVVNTPFYRSESIVDNCNYLKLLFKGDWAVEFRAYDDGVAYRFSHSRKEPFNIANERVEFRMTEDCLATLPYVIRGNSVEEQLFNSFENIYTQSKLSELDSSRLSFLPLVVEYESGVKLSFTESDLESYPGLYLYNPDSQNHLCGLFARYPKSLEQGGHNNLQMIVKEREEYIARVDSPRSFPWRIIGVTDCDKRLAMTNLTYLLASPSRVEDISWIRPGKVAWEWWNDWNIGGVDFNSGVNTQTYKHYIDFASEMGVEYVILDEGWSVNLAADLMQVVPEIDLPHIVEYAESRGVGIILWAGYHAFDRDMERVCEHYSKMGVKGFKVDFMDRDDQIMTTFNYRAAEVASRYHLILDLHGTHKPAGLNRTYPNVLNFEGVHGLEQMKWSPVEVDQVTYDVMIPFIRQISGPMDYTQGAMRNAVIRSFYPNFSEPMSQGTRCRQLALYVILESPLNMLCDSPTAYRKERESAEFIARVPTTWDETIVLDGKMGEYILTARRGGGVWYVGGITNHDSRSVEVDLSTLGLGDCRVVLFRDGVNAERLGSDYKRVEFTHNMAESIEIKMASAGGFVMEIHPLK